MMHQRRSAAAVMVTLGAFLLLSCARVESNEVTIDAGADGGEVELERGQVLNVALEGNPTTGYGWEAVELDQSVLDQVGDPAFTPESEALGAPGTQVLRFRAVGEGRCRLRLVYHRPWEEGEPEEAFAVDVVVR